MLEVQTNKKQKNTKRKIFCSKTRKTVTNKTHTPTDSPPTKDTLILPERGQAKEVTTNKPPAKFIAQTDEISNMAYIQKSIASARP